VQDSYTGEGPEQTVFSLSSCFPHTVEHKGLWPSDKPTFIPYSESFQCILHLHSSGIFWPWKWGIRCLWNVGDHL